MIASIFEDDQNTNYQVTLENFSGPFDLLLHLIEKEEVDIYDISISTITDDYLRYIEKMRENKLDVGSEFLVMATSLLEMKSRLLLPVDILEQVDSDMLDPDSDPAFLLDRLVEYKMFKKLAEVLETLFFYASRVFYREQAIDKYIRDNNIQVTYCINTRLNMLTETFENVWEGYTSKKDDSEEIKQELVTVKNKIQYILNFLACKERTKFSEIILNKDSYVDIIVSFLAILEITKRNIVKISQKELFSEIEILRL